MIKVTEVEVLDGLNLRIRFDDGTQRVVDLDPLMPAVGKFRELREDRKLFSAAFVDPPTGGVVSWPNGIDVDPEILHGDEVPAWWAG